MSYLKQRGAFQADRAFALFMVVPILLFVFGELFYANFGWQAAEKRLPELIFPLTEATSRLEGTNRAWVLSTFLLFILVSLSAISLFLIDLAKLFGKKARASYFKIAIAILVLIAAFLIFIHLSEFATVEDLINVKVLESALQMASSHPTNGVNETGNYLFALFERLLWIFHIFMAIASTSLLAGAISCLAKPKTGTMASNRRRLWRIQQRRLRYYLLGATLMLTSGLMFQMAWMYWPTFSMEQSLGRNEFYISYQFHANALNIYYGLLYSLVIASYYLPIAFKVGQRLQNAGGSDDSVPLQEIKNSLALFIQFVAIALPAFTGLASPILGLV